jgi:capsular exopolysaccharide synthesis family protein
MNSINTTDVQPHEEELDVKEVLRIIRGYTKPIAIILAIALIITIYITLTTQPIYQATSAVMVKENVSNAGSMVFDFGMSSAKQRLQNEIEVLKSFNLHNQVVQSLIDDGSANELSLFGTRYTRYRFRLTDFFKVKMGQSSSPEILPNDLTINQRISIVEKLRKSTKIGSIRETDVLKINVASSDSSDSIFLTNRVSEVYRKLDLAGGQGELHFLLTFLDSQMAKYESRLADVENELQQFQSKNQIYALDGSAQLLLSDLTDYESIYFTNLAELEVASERVKYLKSQLSDSEQALMKEITNTNNPMIVALRGRIAELEAQKVQQMVSEGWSEQSMQARDFDRRVNEMKRKLTSVTESLILSGWSEEDPFAASQGIFNRIVEQEVEVHSAKSRAEEYNKLVGQMSDRLTNLPSLTLKYARLERELKLNENLYLNMKQKYEESRITEAGQRGKVHVLDPAIIAEKVKPNKKINLFLGIFLGLGFGLGYAFLKEFLDNTIKAVEQLERKGLTVLGIIPDMSQHSQKSLKKNSPITSKTSPQIQRRLITHEDPKSPVSESYRSLRTNITFASVDKKIKSILVSSPQPGEGKSTTVANLAIAFAQLRKRTLLVDADLRKPVQHNIFDKQRGPGLSEYIIGKIQNAKDIIQETGIENLSIVAAGGLPPNPSELLGSNRMSKLIDRLEQEWDIILFDSPPIVAVTDSSMISAEIDALVMVVKAGQTDRAAVDRALDTISNVKSPLAGVILNGASPHTLSGKYSYYYSYYNYYYNSDEEK